MSFLSACGYAAFYIMVVYSFFFPFVGWEKGGNVCV